MRFDDRYADGLDGIANGIAVMRECACVDDDAVILFGGLMDAVDQLALPVGLHDVATSAALTGMRLDVQHE